MGLALPAGSSVAVFFCRDAHLSGKSARGRGLQAALERSQGASSIDVALGYGDGCHIIIFWASEANVIETIRYRRARVPVFYESESLEPILND